VTSYQIFVLKTFVVLKKRNTFAVPIIVRTYSSYNSLMKKAECYWQAQTGDQEVFGWCKM